MYSPLNSDTYSNDQNPSVLKFRINPRPQKEANEKKKKGKKFKSRKAANEKKKKKKKKKKRSYITATSQGRRAICLLRASFLFLDSLEEAVAI
ncbi:hypothetical protein llap_20562 [Limosa lapponica baueri]|uniref:Uncharacterized protein n=1 Tax=Limosa lapponica baueri TaxID=1758121 RepID=A0A2I0T5R0_LIMLA|nr:hypothetical protein llap_20562 [Limosa lapponica baueri]